MNGTWPSPVSRDEADEPLVILIADDDPDDRLFITQAFKRSRLRNPLEMVEDGEELLDYLYRRGAYAQPGKAPRPGLILLDLNMPRMDGREALRQIKSDPALRRIPVVVMTTSSAEDDVLGSYDLGVNAYVQKPLTLPGLVRAADAIGDFWLRVVRLPPVAEP